ncbi:DUF5615 family PIN-like protein [Candidatus Acetothermia bacterium]|nr:DUF5615 family PIN-like protein [Candidatus Acetothermia bacterium]MBI3460941.1 DUF5615 family PIN-like protein [Candidatus Acetothermia bacterium]
MAERLFIALFIDENVDNKLGPALRRYGYDAATARETERKGVEDEEQLEYAVQHKMAIFSHNVADFAKLHERWLSESKEHYGIVLTSTPEFRPLLKKVLEFLDRFTAEEIMNQRKFI